LILKDPRRGPIVTSLVILDPLTEVTLVDVTPLSIEGAFLFTPVIHTDDRGSFMEWFRVDALEEATGHPLHLAQANSSTSAVGTIRGIHFAQLPPGQAKYVTCVRGAILDVVVDIRTGSSTYGRWEAVPLDAETREAVYLSEGLGHAFIALDDDTVVSYLCSAPYAPGREHGIDPYDTTLAIEWPTIDRWGEPLEHRLSPKDASAPGLAEVRLDGLLPSVDDARAWVRALREGGGSGTQ
jgi:dTDP-4-dehydrorhamnose 3,5-epimerase